MKKKKHYVKPSATAVIVCTESLLVQASGGVNIDTDGTVTSPGVTEGNPSEIDAGKNNDLWIDEDE